MCIRDRPHIIEGRNLDPLLHGERPEWRQYAVSEYDYATRDARRMVEVDQSDARLVMIYDGRWKYVHVETMRPLLFDLLNDPAELHDLGGNPLYAEQIDRLAGLHFEWARQHHTRITRSAEVIEAMTDEGEPPGIVIAYWDEADMAAHGIPMPTHIKNQET